MSDEFLTPDDGVIRLFPLPNLVLFPGAMQPLHIFEPRYREMTADALDGDRLIALVLPQPGWEADYAGKPSLHAVACVGRILAEQRLDDGCFNILLRGLQRIRIVAEVDAPKLYRVARVEPLEEAPCVDLAVEAECRGRMREEAEQWFEDQVEVRDRFTELIDSGLPLGALADLIAFALPLEVEFKQTLLAEVAVERRLDRLLRHLSALRRPFPPEFSAN